MGLLPACRAPPAGNPPGPTGFSPLTGIHGIVTQSPCHHRRPQTHRFSPLTGIHGIVTTVALQVRISPVAVVFSFSPLTGIHGIVTIQHPRPRYGAAPFQSPDGDSWDCYVSVQHRIGQDGAASRFQSPDGDSWDCYVRCAKCGQWVAVNVSVP